MNLCQSNVKFSHYSFPRSVFPQYLLITKKHKLWRYSSENKNIETNDIIMTKMSGGKQWIMNSGITGKGFKQPSGLRRISSGSRSVPMSWHQKQELQEGPKDHSAVCVVIDCWGQQTKFNHQNKQEKRNSTDIQNYPQVLTSRDS